MDTFFVARRAVLREMRSWTRNAPNGRDGHKNEDPVYAEPTVHYNKSGS